MPREEINAEDFDFGFENFRAMGYTFTGIVREATVTHPEDGDVFEWVDKASGESRSAPAKPQLTILIDPTDHDTKSGNPIPQYMTLTRNVRSKLGIFIEHLNELGINMQADPSVLEGKHFEWEVKEVSFGGSEPTRVTVPIGLVDALSDDDEEDTSGRLG